MTSRPALSSCRVAYRGREGRKRLLLPHKIFISARGAATSGFVELKTGELGRHLQMPASEVRAGRAITRRQHCKLFRWRRGKLYVGALDASATFADPVIPLKVSKAMPPLRGL